MTRLAMPVDGTTRKSARRAAKVHDRCPALVRDALGRVERRFLVLGQEVQRVA